MYSFNMLNGFKKAAILFSISFGVVLISDATVQAQKRYYRTEGDPRTYRTNPNDEGREVARQYGFDDGFKDGAEAGRDRDVYNPTKSGDYKKGANGYDDDFGSKPLYRQSYRSAYLQGYKRGYRRYTEKTFIKNKNVRRRL
jgi:hypothetical protein